MNPKDIFESICTTNDNLIVSNSKLMSFIFFPEKNNIGVIALNFDDDKVAYANSIKSYLAKKGVKWYILIADCKKTSMKDNTFKGVVDCSVRTLYSPNDFIMEFADYRDGVILHKERFTERKDKDDIWDLWNSTELIKSDLIDAYVKYKKKNKSKYKGCL